jgi:hypothetical protein
MKTTEIVRIIGAAINHERTTALLSHPPEELPKGHYSLRFICHGRPASDKEVAHTETDITHISSCRDFMPELTFTDSRIIDSTQDADAYSFKFSVDFTISKAA